MKELNKKPLLDEDKEALNKLTDWENAPKLEDLKTDYDAAKIDHQTQVLKIIINFNIFYY